MQANSVGSALATLLVTVDPVGLTPIFLSLTAGMSRVERRAVAIRAAVIGFAILAYFAWGGAALLGLLGIGLPAFQIAGAILLFWIALEMVFDGRIGRKRRAADMGVRTDEIRMVAAFPLGIPLIAGPGSITATMLTAAESPGDPAWLATLTVLIAATMAACAVVFVAAEVLSGLLGKTGNIVLSRLLGIILAALATQFFIDGAAAAIRSARL